MADRKEFRDLASPEAAHQAVSSLELTPAPETVPLSEALGRILAERIDATLDVPGFDRSAMDGYAVRARDTFGAEEANPVELNLAGTVHAGEKPSVKVDPGTCVEISTGAVLPPGADAVVVVERTSKRNETVEIRTAVTPGDNVMFAGADIAAGERALGPGTPLTAREIGLLSALGIDSVPVRGRPVVGIVSTGDELVRPGSPLNSDRGEIYDVNSYTIAAGVEEAGGEPRVYPHSGDDFEELERVLREAADECDLVLSSGSTSAGAVDIVYRVIQERGELLLHGVAVKPGKPMLVGRLDASAYIGLPGYPVSALTIFRTFVAPAIRDAAGRPEPVTGTIEGKMAVGEQYAEGRLRYLPVGLVEDGAGETLVYPVDKGSGATTSLVEADGVIEMEPTVTRLDAGTSVSVQLFSPDARPPTLFGVGEDDPVLARVLDRIERPRYLAIGSRPGLRRLKEGVPDIAVTAGPSDDDSSTDRREESGVELGKWYREWGLIVPTGNPDDVDGIADLIDRDLRFVNRTTSSGLRTSLMSTLADVAATRGIDRHELVKAVDGFDRAVQAHESPARRVAEGKADVGLGLRATADKLELGFVSLGYQPVRVRAAADRTGKPGVEALGVALEDVDTVLANLAGFTVREP